MTQKEVNEKIRLSENQDWFKNIELTFDYSSSGLTLPKKGFSSIYVHIKKQHSGWVAIKESLPNELQQSKVTFKRLFDSLNFLLNESIALDQNQLRNYWNQNIDKIVRGFSNNIIMPVDQPAVAFLINQFKINPSNFSGAYHYLFQPQNSISFNNIATLDGAFSAYEFVSQGASDITKRSRYEKSSISSIRTSFERQFNETQKTLDEFLDTTSTKSSEYIKQVDKLLDEKKAQFESWFEKSNKQESEFHSNSVKRMDDSQELYKNLLILKEPANYWKDRATDLRKEGNNWLRGLIVAIAVSVITLILVLNFISDGTLKEVFDKTGYAIRWSIVFVTLISFLAFAIRTFSKLAFSAYHLVRDAEERQQLVYVYLALQHEKAVDEKERLLVLQSIFSRSDSGLLKDDSSPTMPGSAGIIEKMMK